jgi:ribonuclease HI
MPPGSVERLITDSTYVKSRISEIRHNMVLEDYVPDELRRRLKTALDKHPDIEISWKKRHKGKIPIADNFAKAAANGDKDKIVYWCRKYSVELALAPA